MNVVAIVQARVGSSRLPAKVLLDLGGATALERCIQRVQRFEGLSEVVVATTTNPEDDLIVSLARRRGYRVTRGSADDVLSRYVEAGRATRADVVVRCTSDCPLLDPALSSQVIRTLVASLETSEPIDYASNNLERRFPRGLDTEVVLFSALERALTESTSASEREHVTLHVYRHPEKFRLRAVVPDTPDDWSDHRWTLDTLDDYQLLSALFDALGDRAPFADMHDVLDVFARNPELKQLNAHIEQKKVRP